MSIVPAGEVVVERWGTILPPLRVPSSVLIGG